MSDKASATFGFRDVDAGEKAGLVRGVDVFVDHRRDIPRGEGVQIECALDRNAMRHGYAAV